MPAKGIKRCTCGSSDWEIVRHIGLDRTTIQCKNCGRLTATQSSRRTMLKGFFDLPPWDKTDARTAEAINLKNKGR